MSVIFITGSTGFIGKEILKQLTAGEEKLLLLVRSLKRATAMLNELGLEQDERICLLKGNLAKPELGMCDADLNRALEADIVIHAGGPMSVTLEEGAAKQTFLDGAYHITELARRIHHTRGLHHFIHVVGFMSPFHEGNIDMEADVFELEGFMKGEGAYERMKFLADLYIRQQAKRLGYPLSVVNPGTVIGAKPAGVTEQTEGIGILVNAVRRRLMPVVPGGQSHWIPFVANDDLARMIIHLARKVEPSSNTYTILEDKASGPDMHELLTTISNELHLSSPRLSAPMPLLRSFMKAGFGHLAGIPAESMSFITNRSFQTAETKRVLREMGSADINVRDIIPMVIADLDYRFTHPNYISPVNFTRERKGDMAALVRKGDGIPWVIIHGLLSSADDFVPLAQHLHERTGSPVWLLDLPGFGRSPFLGHNDVPDAYIDALHQIIATAPGRIRLIGHSFGAIIAAKAAQMAQSHIEQLFLLQPVLHRPQSLGLQHWLSASTKLSKFLLKRLTPKALTNMMLREGVFSEASEIPEKYVETIVRNLSSPRIAAANARVLQALHYRLPSISPVDFSNINTTIIWGTKDKAYTLPEPFHCFSHLQLVPYAHHFPMSYPQETAQLLNRL
ncbi:alpha/beta fold hydrolase [Aneurinibacillus aneurinilyticus]|uniref:Alpha/beta fold hydrolase n=1 Tax=Aneurinibacillus aneurinilyticus TaxID=1391 RepID=A0A848CX43_ANEAE|nr:alpha/beta fold hydrolase [Aneurinibacillus aneurinilyticus]NME98112.1 alpha/beta fold hydrolase [Aneurinibacillus aneurinilyticus]